ncbi:hypothetical protein VULLAG_LOCUS18230 [Vulpes lagopus]
MTYEGRARGALRHRSDGRARPGLQRGGAECEGGGGASRASDGCGRPARPPRPPCGARQVPTAPSAPARGGPAASLRLEMRKRARGLAPGAAVQAAIVKNTRSAPDS